MRQLLGVLLSAALAGQQTFAATFNVTNTADSGAGSLRQAVSDSDTAGGVNTISWGAGSGGATAIASDLLSISANTTLDVTNAPSAVTISGAPSAMPLGGAVTFNNNNAAQAWTISTVVGGAGSVNKNGAGVLNLTGTNTYLGGTTINAGTLNVNSDAALGNAPSALIINGGTLQASGYVASNRGVTLGGAATFDSNGNTIVEQGDITGAGSLTKIGAGILYLNATDTYAGATYLNGGTISITSDFGPGNGGLVFGGGTLQTQFSLTDSRAITLNAGGGAFDTAGSTATFTGIISGAGGLTTISSGTLILTGANTYTGGTTVGGGNVVAIYADNNLGDPSGLLTLSNGGTLRSQQALISARNISLGAGGGVIDTNGFNSTLSGNISGAGGLTKINGGVLTLSGSNSYAGGTNINQDTIQYGANNVLPTNGALTVASGATVDMFGFNQTQSLGAVVNAGTMNLRTGRLALNNGYSGGGILAMTLQSGFNNITNNSANAIALSGGTLSLTLANPLLTNGQQFKPITGTIAGQFSQIQSPAAFQFIPTYNNATGLTLTTQFVPFAQSAANSNQNVIAAGIEAMRNTPTGDAANVLLNLYTMDAPHLQAALDQIGPVSLACMSGLSMAASAIQSSAVSRRMTVLADGRDHAGLEHYTVSGRSSFPGTLVAEGPGDTTEAYGSGGDVEGKSPWGFYTSALASVGRLTEGHTDAGLQPGYAFDTGGFAGGADYRLSDQLTGGLSVGYLHGHASLYAPAAGTADNDSARYGLYASGFTDRLHINAYAGSAEDFFTTNRGIIFGNLARTATGSPRGHEINLYGGSNYDFETMYYGIWSPFAALNFDQMMIDPFTEDGAGALNLNVGSQVAKSLRSSLGLRWAEKNEWRSMLLTTYLSAGWRHEFDSQSRPIDAQLASGVGSPFTVTTGNFARDGTLLGGGMSFDFNPQTTAKLDYTGDFRSHFMDNAFNASVRFRF